MQLFSFEKQSKRANYYPNRFVRLLESPNALTGALFDQIGTVSPNGNILTQKASRGERARSTGREVISGLKFGIKHVGRRQMSTSFRNI